MAINIEYRAEPAEGITNLADSLLFTIDTIGGAGFQWTHNTTFPPG
jgi:hypothetical protein